MKVSIHQPNYIPYPGVFHKMIESDIFVHLDDVQFSNHGMHDWNYIKTPAGKHSLKIPVNQTLGQTIMEVSTKDSIGWKDKHIKTIEMNYKKASYYNEVMEFFVPILQKQYCSIAEMNISIIESIASKLGIRPTFIRSSRIKAKGNKCEKVINTVKAINGTEYISGNGAKVYQEEKDFEDNGIKLTYTGYKPLEYKQQWEKRCPFISNLSIIDYLMNCGFNLWLKGSLHNEWK